MEKKQYSASRNNVFVRDIRVFMFEVMGRFERLTSPVPDRVLDIYLDDATNGEGCKI